MATLIIRDAASGEVLGRPEVGSRAVLSEDREGTLASFQATEIGRWVGHQLELIAAPDWHPDEPRLAASQAEALARRVRVADEYNY